MIPGPCCAGDRPYIPPLGDASYDKLLEMNTHVYLKNTVSGVVEQFTAKDAERYLRLYPSTLVRVDSPKNEILAPPYTVGDAGERVRFSEPVTDSPPTPKIFSKKKAREDEADPDENGDA